MSYFSKCACKRVWAFSLLFDVLATTAPQKKMKEKKKKKKWWVCQVWVIRRVLSLSFCKLCFAYANRRLLLLNGMDGLMFWLPEWKDH